MHNNSNNGRSYWHPPAWGHPSHPNPAVPSHQEQIDWDNLHAGEHDIGGEFALSGPSAPAPAPAYSGTGLADAPPVDPMRSYSYPATSNSRYGMSQQGNARTLLSGWGNQMDATQSATSRVATSYQQSGARQVMQYPNIIRSDNDLDSQTASSISIRSRLYQHAIRRLWKSFGYQRQLRHNVVEH
jgi:hypothetical protein